MIVTVGTAIGVFMSTSVDYLVMLVLLFTQQLMPIKKFDIYVGQFLGTTVMVGVSLITVYVLSFIPDKSLLGLLGFIPLGLGIYLAFQKDKDEESQEVMEKLQQRKFQRHFLTVALLTIASGADNLGIYIPYFATSSLFQLLVALFIFMIGIIVLVEGSYFLSKIVGISEKIETYEQLLIPLVFILLGSYILWENETLSLLLKLLS